MTAQAKVFDAGDVVLQSGITLKGARIVYTTYGTLNAHDVGAAAPGRIRNRLQCNNGFRAYR